MDVKRKYLRVLSAILAAICVAVCLPDGKSFALFNDAEYEDYVNMAPGSQIPGLFKNDSVFSDYKDTPLIISGGTEYVPLSLFSGMTGVVVNFSSDMSNFYIQNKNRNKYISFNIPNNYAVTGENKVYETRVHTYYGTNYVPLLLVCEATGIGCDIYNDTKNKIYVVKVFTSAGLSASELIKIHAPSIYQQNEPPTPPDNIGRRNLYLSVAGGSLSENFALIDTFSAYGIKGAFFLTKDEIFGNPDIVRKIYTDGHTIGITFGMSARELARDGVLEAECAEAEDALYEIIKTKTRLVVLPDDDSKEYEKSRVQERLTELGLRNVTFNIDARTDTLGGAGALSAVTSSIRNNAMAAVHIKLTFSPASRTVVAGLYNFSRENSAVTFRLLSEGTR